MAKAAALPSLGRPVRNVAWNLAGGLWAGVLVVLVTPRFVAILGLEGYSLVGLWLMMQVLLGLMDLGLGATLVRGFADAGGDPDSGQRRADLLRTLEAVYWPVAGLLALALVLASRTVATRWLNIHALDTVQVSTSLKLIALALGLQFPSTLYANGLIGLQNHRLMNALQMLGNGLRYGAGLLILLWRADPVVFFALQAGVAGLQTLLNRWMLWRMVAGGAAARPRIRMERLGQSWRFSAGMALTAVIGLLMGNMDRIALSRMVAAEELGKYAVAFTATGIIQMGVQPFYRAYFPRFTELVAAGNPVDLRAEYFRGCRLMALVLIPVAVIGWVFAGSILFAWLGRSDPTIVTVFRYLLAGGACAGLMWLPAAFQQAHGWTRLHVTMMLGALVLGTPAMVWAIKIYGSPGATLLWMVHGLSDLTLGLWLMHRRLLVGDGLAWLRTVVLAPALGSALVVGLSWWLVPPGLSRWLCLGWAAGTGAVVVLVTLCLYRLEIFRNY